MVVNPNFNHPNGKVVVKTGHHIELPAPYPSGRGRQAGYWKHGIRLEVKEWLDANIGKCCTSQHLWEEGEGDWIHTGVTGMKCTTRGQVSFNAHFWIRDHWSAMLFKLRWNSHL